jgi:E3 ubiquitin-protein ligase UBR3
LYKQFNIQSSPDDLSNITYQTYLQQLNETSSLLIPISLRTDPSSVYFDIKTAICLLDEILFWLIKYQIPERLLKLLLMLLTDLNFKRLFTQSFLNIYSIAIAQLINSRQRINTSRLVHISVQLFSNHDITIQAIKEFHLLEIMLSSLYSIFSKILINCQLQKSNENYHLVISEMEFSKNMHYWPIVSDFINVLSHEYASREFLTQKRFFITWIKIISWFQGNQLN